jgi:hypothetical protein
MQTEGRLPDRQQFVDGGSRKADLIGCGAYLPISPTLVIGRGGNRARGRRCRKLDRGVVTSSPSCCPVWSKEPAKNLLPVEVQKTFFVVVKVCSYRRRFVVTVNCELIPLTHATD